MVDMQKLQEPFPKQAIKQRKGGGGRSFDYVEGHTVIHRLNAATENQWSFRVPDITSRTIKTERGESTLLTAKVELEIHGLGARQHIGVQMVTDGGGEDLVKGVITDALKKAATLFGVGLELYGPDYESGEMPPQRQNAPQAAVRGDNRRYGQAADNAQQDAPAHPQPNTDGILATPKQIKYLYWKAEENGWTKDAVAKYLKETFKVGSSSEMTKTQMSKAIEHIEGVPAGQ